MTRIILLRKKDRPRPRHTDSVPLNFPDRAGWVREFRFHETRMWRFDFAHPWLKIAVECEGGVWSRGGGRHNRGIGFIRDMEKYNAAGFAGWTVFRFTTDEFEEGAPGRYLRRLFILRDSQGVKE